MENLAATLDGIIRETGIAISGVSIGDPGDKTTWTVQPSDLQSAAQAIIDGFDVEANATAAAWVGVRRVRTSRLARCDWTQLSDAPISSEQVAAWRVYRQALRNVPQDNSDPSVINWPVAPDGVGL